MPVSESVADLINSRLSDLTATEHRLARLVIDDPEAVAFGTSLNVGKAVETSAPSVVRFANKLGYTGFTELQRAIRRDLSIKVNSALRRANDRSTRTAVSEWIEIETLNVVETLSAIDPDMLNAAIGLLSDTNRKVFILASEQWAGPGQTFTDYLRLTRGRVTQLAGSSFRVATHLAAARPDDVIITMDAQRNESWVEETHAMARKKGLRTIAITDSHKNPIALESEVHFRVWRATAGLFESKTGLCALLNYLLDAVGKACGDGSIERLSESEKSWANAGALSGDLSAQA
jgi:DNA-binding MurR/RpiR family transcriptional regulator